MPKGFNPQVSGATRVPGMDSRARRNSQAMATRGLPNQLPISVLELNADTSIGASEGVLLVEPDALLRTLTIPSAASLPVGTWLWIKNVDAANNFTLDVASSGTIDGTGGGTTVTPLESFMLITGQATDDTNPQWYKL